MKCKEDYLIKYQIPRQIQVSQRKEENPFLYGKIKLKR